MSTWLYPGSFDPVTMGHMDIIARASRLCDRLLVAVLKNDAKKGTFSVEERLDFLRRSTGRWPNVEVFAFSGLTVELLRQTQADAVLRGLRNVNDFVFEQQVAMVNRGLDPQAETLLMMSSPTVSHISSSMVLSVGLHGGSLSGLVPDAVLEDISRKLSHPMG